MSFGNIQLSVLFQCAAWTRKIFFFPLSPAWNMKPHIRRLREGAPKGTLGNAWPSIFFSPEQGHDRLSIVWPLKFIAMQKQSLEFKGREKTQEKLRGLKQNDDIGFLYLEFPHVRMQAIFAIKQPDLEIEPPLQHYQSIVIVMQPWNFFFLLPNTNEAPC